MAELGVYRGEFAKFVLENNPQIDNYLLVDPWRYIPSWNKPANTTDDQFEQYFRDTLQATDFAESRRTILRGTTTEVIGNIANESLDAIYIDGDHTLKGISIDLICMVPKVKHDGWILGDDFVDTIWQHSDQFEPTMIFPFVAYFAEAHGFELHALPFNQFAMRKRRVGYRLIDHTQSYGDTSVLRHVVPR